MKSQTLKENKEFRYMYYNAKSESSSCLVTYAKKNRYAYCRIGITTSKKIGNAVNRNRAKRVIRAAYSQIEENIQENWDFVFVARTKTCHVKMEDVLKDMKTQLTKIGVIDEMD